MKIIPTKKIFFLFFWGENISGGEDAVYRRLLYKEKKSWTVSIQMKAEVLHLWARVVNVLNKR